MEKSELSRLEAYLRKTFGSPELVVRAKRADQAELRLGEATLADISKDEDEGEMSYFVNMGVARAAGAAKDAPITGAELTRLQEVLRERLGAKALSVRARPRKTDSAEVYVGEEFVGTVSRDEESREFGHFLTMSILDIDLED